MSAAASEGTARWLCAGDTLEEGGLAHVFDVLAYGQPARAFVLRVDGQVVGFLNRCVHVPTEMDWQEGQFLDADKRFIVCSIHGATYDPADGRCVGGPCGKGRLTPLAVREAADGIWWQPGQGLKPLDFDEAAPAPAHGTP